MRYTRVVIHRPKKEADMQKLLREISQFRAEQTTKYLTQAGLGSVEITRLVSDLHSTQKG